MSDTLTIEDRVRATYQQWLADAQFKQAVSDAQVQELQEKVQELTAEISVLQATQSTSPEQDLGDSRDTPPIVLD